MLGFIKYCICGKVCTSKPGLTLHQRYCKIAQNAIRNNKSSIIDTEIEYKIQYTNQVSDFINLAEFVAYDTHLALKDKNKSAGRRARARLIILKKMITPLRKEILKKINGI